MLWRNMEIFLTDHIQVISEIYCNVNTGFAVAVDGSNYQKYTEVCYQ